MRHEATSRPNLVDGSNENLQDQITCISLQLRQKHTKQDRMIRINTQDNKMIWKFQTCQREKYDALNNLLSWTLIYLFWKSRTINKTWGGKQRH